LNFQSDKDKDNMALVFRFPYCYSSYYNRTAPGFDFFHGDLWREIALAGEQTGDTCCQRKDKSPLDPIKIARVPLKQYKPEEISVDVDSENITLHGQHQSEDENGFENSEFKKVIKLPEGVDPSTVTSRAIQNGGTLLIEGNKRFEEKAKEDDGKFAVKLDLSGFKPEEVNVQLRGQELTITGKHRSEEGGFHLSRDYSRRILLPDDADVSSVTSRLSKEGLLTIEAPRDPALLPRERNLEVTREVDGPQPGDEAKQTTSE